MLWHPKAQQGRAIWARFTHSAFDDDDKDLLLGICLHALCACLSRAHSLACGNACAIACAGMGALYGYNLHLVCEHEDFFKSDKRVIATDGIGLGIAQVQVGCDEDAQRVGVARALLVRRRPLALHSRHRRSDRNGPSHRVVSIQSSSLECRVLYRVCIHGK
eukprot:1021594-Pleurochrysis_carterae.AAC.3